MTSVGSAAPGGASMPGTEMAGPPGCATGTAGRSNRSRSRPGWSLGGTICAPGGTTCATAANETLTIAKAAAMARTPASIPTDPRRTDRNFTSGGVSEQSSAGAVNGPVLAIFPDVSIRSHRPRRPSAGRDTKGEVFVGPMLRGPSKAGASKHEGPGCPNPSTRAGNRSLRMRPSPPGPGCDPRLVAQLHWKMEGAAVVGKGGAGEARRPEGRGWIVREAVALLGLAEQAGLHLGLIALGVENGDGIGPRRDTVEHAGRVSVLDRRDRAAHFAARLAETVGGSIEPAAHGPAVVAETADGYAQFPRRLRARPGCKREHEDEGEKRRPHRISPVVARHLALSKAMPKPSSGRLISIGFLLASCTVILRSLPARMAAMNLSVSVMATKHPTLVQVWIDCRSAVPLSTFTKTGSVRLRPSG